MSDLMTFPNTVEEFMEKYKIVDTEHVYTNGIEMVPIFRMQQWFDHARQCRNNVQSAEAIYKLEEGDGMVLRASAKEGMWRELAASYERTIVKLTEAIAEQAKR